MFVQGLMDDKGDLDKAMQISIILLSFSSSMFQKRMREGGYYSLLLINFDNKQHILMNLEFYWSLC